MDMRFLHSFVTVAESGSIADAARRLGLAPTTVAQQIRALEADLGSRLLTRAGRTVRPTVAGARIVDRARELLRGERDLRSAASDTGLPAGPMRLGATPTALMGLVPPLLRRWMRAHPDIQIYIEPGTSSVLLERVMAGQLDAAILVHPNFELHKTCAWSLIREERLVLLAPSALRVGNALRVAAREPFIQYDRPWGAPEGAIRAGRHRTHFGAGRRRLRRLRAARLANPGPRGCAGQALAAARSLPIAAGRHGLAALVRALPARSGLPRLPRRRGRRALTGAAPTIRPLFLPAAMTGPRWRARMSPASNRHPPTSQPELAA